MLSEQDNPTFQPSAASAAEAEHSPQEPQTGTDAPSGNHAELPAVAATTVPEPAAEASAHGDMLAARETHEAAASAAGSVSPPGSEAATPDANEVEALSSSQAAAADTAAAGGEVAETFDDKLIDQYAAPQPATSEGNIVEGQVVAITELGVVVDMGAKNEGLIPAQEFLDAESGIPLVPGQTVEVLPLDVRKEGYVLLSYQRARRRRAWENIEKSYRAKVTLTGKVVDRIKGGLVVDIGIRAFLPASQVDTRPTHDLESWKDKDITIRVLKMNRKRGNVVVSRRVILDEDLQAQRQKLLDSLEENQVVTGKVKNITDYGVFVDLGGLDGLLHITDLSWGRLKHPSDAVAVDQEIGVKVLKFDREKMRVSLGRKQLMPDPWASAPERFPVGARVPGRVVGITDYGAFVELDAGIEGLVHISEMTWSKRLKHPSKIVSLGDNVEVVVLDLKPGERRISLGLKQTTPDPWQSLAEKYPVGTVVSGKVRNLTEFGAFVEIEEGFDGLIHVSDISWTERVKNPAEVFKKGETVQARVLKIDAVNRRVSLGIKQVNDIWANWFAEHKVNDVVRGKVSRLTSFGAFVELAAGIEGLCHISEIEDRRKKGDPAERESRRDKPTTALEAGQEYDFKIVKLQPDQHKIGLSFRGAQKQAERREVEEYRSSKSSPTATLGDVFYSKRNSA